MAAGSSIDVAEVLGKQLESASPDLLRHLLDSSGRGQTRNSACAKAGLGGLHFHDLRHVGGTLAATTGASLRELMARLGHSSTRAALIYQHATRDRDQAIALALGDLVREVRTVQPDQAPEAAN